MKISVVVFVKTNLVPLFKAQLSMLPVKQVITIFVVDFKDGKLVNRFNDLIDLFLDFDRLLLYFAFKL